MMSAKARNGVAALLLAAAFFALFMLKEALTLPPPIDPAGEFNTARAIERLSRILGDERPHPVDSEANDAVRERLVAELRAIGYEPELRDDFSCRLSKRGNAVTCARVRNIVVRTGPSSGKTILIASHYDSVAAGPGAADDGAGVAAALEIAAIVKTRMPAKPVIFLFTDGEETGLNGAHSFVARDPLAKEVAAVINMEARGATGAAVLFETSEPNGRDVAAYSKRISAPAGNSLATDIYKMMPNDTDMSEFLKLGSDGLNLAFTGSLPIYHTPMDNIANLDRRSLAHIGSSALASVDGYLRDIENKDWRKEGRVVFADVATRSILVLPTIAALVLILAGLVASVAAFLQMPGARPVRAALAPLAAVAIAGLLAFASLAAVAALRPEASYWYAAPHWTRAVIYLSAVAGGVSALWIAADADRRRLLAASWFWFSALGLGAYLAAPGSALITGLPAALFACAAVASYGATRLLAPISLIGVAAALLLWLPTLHHAEQGLGLGASWPFAMLAALLFVLAAPVFTQPARMPGSAILAALAVLFAGVLFALTAPAYSPSAPRPLNLQHVVDAQTGEALVALSPIGEPAPKELQRRATFGLREIKGLTGARYAAAASPHDGQAVGVEIVSSVLQEFGRTVSMRFRANGADEIVLIAPDDAALIETRVGGETIKFGERDEKIIRCSGRACADFSVIAVVGRTPVEWSVLGVHRGLGAEMETLKGARPDWAVPAHGGDVRIVLSHVSI